MFKIEDFCYNIDLGKPNHFEFLKEVGKLPPDLEMKEDMDEKQRKIYEDYVSNYKR